MRFLAGLTFLLALNGCGFAPSQSGSPTPTAIETANSEKKDEVFAGVFAGKQARNEISQVSITPTESVIRRRDMILANGPTPVLSMPAEIRNLSQWPITTRLAHEWYGGIWPETDLYLAVKPKVPVHSEDWETAPGFLVGELDSKERDIVLGPGEKHSIDVRLNWPGTGSMETEPLISDGSQGKYLIKFLLFFRSKWGDRHVETQEFEFEVE